MKKPTYSLKNYKGIHKECKETEKLKIKGWFLETEWLGVSYHV